MQVISSYVWGANLMADKGSPKSPEEFKKWLNEQPEPPPISEQTDEQLQKQFTYYEAELDRVKDGDLKHSSELFISFAVEQRLQIALELHKRGVFTGKSPLENEGLDNEFFKALLAMDKKEFYRLAPAPQLLFNGLQFVHLGFDSPADKRKWRIMGDIEQLNNAIMWVHAIHEYKKQFELEPKKKNPK